MFELFTQGERSLARSEGGLGIGLTIVRRLVELHGGSVTATSEGRAGEASSSCGFRRAEESGRAGRGPNRASRRRGRARASWSWTTTWTRPTSMVRLLSCSGTRCGSPTTARAPSRSARNFRPEVMLLDIGLPGIGRLRGGREPAGRRLLPRGGASSRCRATARRRTAAARRRGLRPPPRQAGRRRVAHDAHRLSRSVPDRRPGVSARFRPGDQYQCQTDDTSSSATHSEQRNGPASPHKRTTKPLSKRTRAALGRAARVRAESMRRRLLRLTDHDVSHRPLRLRLRSGCRRRGWGRGRGRRGVGV